MASGPKAPVWEAKFDRKSSELQRGLETQLQEDLGMSRERVIEEVTVCLRRLIEISVAFSHSSEPCPTSCEALIRELKRACTAELSCLQNQVRGPVSNYRKIMAGMKELEEALSGPRVPLPAAAASPASAYSNGSGSSGGISRRPTPYRWAQQQRETLRSGRPVSGVSFWSWRSVSVYSEAVAGHDGDNRQSTNQGLAQALAKRSRLSWIESVSPAAAQLANSHGFTSHGEGSAHQRLTSSPSTLYSSEATAVESHDDVPANDHFEPPESPNYRQRVSPIHAAQPVAPPRSRPARRIAPQAIKSTTALGIRFSKGTKTACAAVKKKLRSLMRNVACEREDTDARRFPVGGLSLRKKRSKSQAVPSRQQHPGEGWIYIGHNFF